MIFNEISHTKIGTNCVIDMPHIFLFHIELASKKAF